MDGFIRIHRKMLDNPIVFKDSDHVAVWIWLLLQADKQAGKSVIFKNEKIILKPGQILTTRKEIAEALNISENKVYRTTKLFESEQQIEQQKSNRNTLITLLKWSEYQKSEQQIKQQIDNKRTTDEQQKPKKKTVKKKQTKPIEPKVYYPNDEKLNQTFLEYIENRKQMGKPMTELAITKAMNNLAKLSTVNGVMDNDKAIAIIDQSIAAGWQGLFPLKENYKSREERGHIDWDSI